ncbi:MAG TPA: LysE family transporter [Verrucomicrobiae bacterium]
MNELREIFESALTGLAFGFLVSVPVGPTNITIINDGAKRGFVYALMIGLGSVAMEVIYCGIAFAGFSSIFESSSVRAAMELISFVLVLWLGLKYMLAKSVPTHLHSIDVVEQKLHPHTAFTTGFVRVLGNPAVLLFWITMTATFLAHHWVEPDWTNKSVCIVGVGAGSAAWFGLLSWAVVIGHQKFSKRTLLNMSRVSGACLLVVAVVLGVKLVKALALPH